MFEVEMTVHNPLSPRSDLTKRIHKRALAIGFDIVGFAKAEPLELQHHRYLEWLDKGYHASMHWLERQAEKRAEVQKILPEAKTVICVALNYDSPLRHDQELNDGTRGKISRYAWGDDYHLVIPTMLKELCDYLLELDPQSKNLFYVDSGPLHEKQWAVHAGIGWQGKHSNIISREHGSFFFLAEVLTSLELEPSEVITDHCGTCTACIEACPTQAIVEPYVVDSRKCISFWTIESKDLNSFPDHIRSHTDGWIFGCDTCQDVCPWNRFRHDSMRTEFSAREDQTEIQLEWVQSMDGDEFNRRFRNSPIKRAKLAGLQRNARMLTEYYQELRDKHAKGDDKAS